MEQDKHKTIVVFRTFRDDGSVIALFPCIPATYRRSECSSYQTVGQHGAACAYLTECTKAPGDHPCALLAKELEALGYNLDVRKRVTQSMHAARYAAMDRTAR